MELIRARLGGEVRDRSLPAGILRAHCAGLQFELADRFGRRAELAVGPAGEIHTADRDAID